MRSRAQRALDRATFVKQGDHVLLCLAEQPDIDFARNIADYLDENLPGVKIAVLGGVSGVVIKQGGTCTCGSANPNAPLLAHDENCRKVGIE